MATKSLEVISSTAVLQKLRVLGLLLQLLWSRCARLTQGLLRTILGFASKRIRIVTDRPWRFLTSKHSLRLLTVVIVTAGASLAVSTRGPTSRTLGAHFKFFWHACFTSVSSNDSRERLEQFYSGQAKIYDVTRNRLLRGRETMLKLSAAHLQELHRVPSGRRRIWVDIGGGTGYNIEKMMEIMPLTFFDAIYLIDLCEPLLDVAKERFSQLGCSNVHILCQDASQFTLPEEGWTDETAPNNSLTFVTCSYSLSMIPEFFPVIDRINDLVASETGLISVVDFYTSGKPLPESPRKYAIGGSGKQCGWFSRWFWQIWFELDNVFLGPQRREYLEYKLETIKSLNGRNTYLLPWVMGIPYYIWLGRPNRSSMDSAHTAGCLASDHRAPDPSYQITNPSRISYDEKYACKNFHTFMYTFTWEDPYEDMKHLQIDTDGSMLVITSAGDNALHYAIEGSPQTIHCVDMNPCQGHLLELKLSALRSLSYEDFFKMFGNGSLNDFSTLLDTKLSPHLSSSCYRFWDRNRDLFDSSTTFYSSGYSGRAIMMARWIFLLTGRSGDVQLLCSAKTIEEQERIWSTRLRPIILNPVVVFFLKHPIFCWNALGVPVNQRNMLLEEGTIYEYVKDTFDPIPTHGLFKDGAYHYLLTFLGEYTHLSCPLYLTRKGFEAMQANGFERIKSMKIHTDKIVSVLRQLPSDDLSCAILMDHLDWFDVDGEEALEEVVNLWRVLKPGGYVLLRSASRRPWYIDLFVSTGFRVTLLQARTPGITKALDGVNMYASFWKAEKP